MSVSRWQRALNAFDIWVGGVFFFVGSVIVLLWLAGVFANLFL